MQKKALKEAKATPEAQEHYRLDMKVLAARVQVGKHLVLKKAYEALQAL